MAMDVVGKAELPGELIFVFKVDGSKRVLRENLQGNVCILDGCGTAHGLLALIATYN